MPLADQQQRVDVVSASTMGIEPFHNRRGMTEQKGGLRRESVLSFFFFVSRG